MCPFGGSTRYSPVCQSEKRIGPLLLHVPPPALTGTEAIVFGLSPRRLTVLSSPLAKKPTVSLAGDQNGWEAPSVPANRCSSGKSICFKYKRA